MFESQDTRNLLENVDAIIQALRADDFQIQGALLQLKTLRAKLQQIETTSHALTDDAIATEFQSLLTSYPQLQKVYLLRHIKEARKSALSAIQRFTELAESGQLSEDEMRRLRRTEEILQKWNEFEEDVRLRYADTQ